MPRAMTRGAQMALLGWALDATSLEYGSEAQIEADNAFHELADAHMTEEEIERVQDGTFKATVEERIEFVLDMFELELPT